jgi:hypothetical protein
MVTIRDYMDKCDLVINTLVNEQKKVVMRNKQKIITLNKMQFIDGFGSDDRVLKNQNPVFSGKYRTGDKRGQKYDFFETGVFYRGFNKKFVGKQTFDIFFTWKFTTRDK